MLVHASEARQVPRSVLEAKPVEERFAAAIFWRVVACDPLAPLVGSEADEGGVVLVPHSMIRSLRLPQAPSDSPRRAAGTAGTADQS